jgi:uncharacterized protein YfaS (alpha-2-macroglobulin family)
VTVDGPLSREVQWVPNRPERIEFPVQVGQPPYAEDGSLAYDEVLFRVGVERISDGATDAFEVKLPIRDDRRRVTVRLLGDLTGGEPLALPEVETEPRPGTVHRSVLVSDQPALVRMVAGLSFLMEYPFGCTEQRVSRARAHLALKRFREILHLRDAEEELKRVVQTALDWIAAVVDPNGLIGYWPGSKGYVSLTAWVVEFLVEARGAGFAVEEKLLDTLTRSLERALRSDYSYFIDGESWAERAYALRALARAGRFNASYAAELARNTQYLNLEATAQVLQAFSEGETSPNSTRKALADRLWQGIVFRLWQGREVYGGLQDLALRRNGLILSSETRTVAETTRALARVQPEQARLQVLIDALVTLGRGDGWGTTNANAAALLALAQVLEPPFVSAETHRAEVRLDDRVQPLEMGPQAPIAHWVGTFSGPAVAALTEGEGSVVIRAETSWVPLADGSQVVAEARGFVVSRELLQFGDEDIPPRRLVLEQPGTAMDFIVGDVVEDHATVVNPADRHYVAVVVPLAAGFEPLNPNLATSPPEATPRGSLTRPPSYAAYLDDQVAFYYDTLPKGTYDFYFRTRATTPGSYIQPAAFAEMMYDGSVRGNGNGARIEIQQQGE